MINLRKLLETASGKLKKSTANLDGVLSKGKGTHAEWIEIINNVRSALAAIQEAERRAAGVKPERD